MTFYELQMLLQIFSDGAADAYVLETVPYFHAFRRPTVSSQIVKKVSLFVTNCK